MAGPTWIVTKALTKPTTVVGASEQASAGYAAANLLFPGRPFLVWRSTDLTSIALKFDFGTAVQLQRVVLNNCFAAETRAWIDGRLIALGDAPVDQQVMVLAGDGVWRPGRVASFGVQSLRRITFAPLCRSNLRFSYSATPDHRWLLEDGSETTQLKAGDRIRIVPSVAERTADWWRGFAHGVVFGDGTQHTYFPRMCWVRLCGQKAQFRAALEEVPEWTNTTSPPSANGDPIVRFKIPKGTSWKRVPDDDTPIEYQAGFLAGWIATDGTVASASTKLDSKNLDALAWVCERAPVLGWCVTGMQEFESRSGFSGVVYRMGRASLVEKSVTYQVMEIADCGRAETVYCVIEESTHSFTLENGIVTGNCNFAQATWAAGDDGTTFGTALGTFAVPINPEVQPRKIACQPIAMPGAHRYLRLTPGTFDAGATFAELGDALFFTAAALAPLEHNVGLPTGTQDQAVEVTPFDGGGSETNENGPPFKRYALAQANWQRGASDSHLNAMRAWFAAGRTVPHLVYENRGEDGQGTSPFAYFVTLDGPVSITELSIKMFTTTAINATERIGG